jgi:sigma-B regulation protein RsbU (phosphoserine phosphatase)
MADEPRKDQPESGVAGLEAEALKQLLDVTRRMNAALDLDAVLTTIVDSLISIARADRGFLMLRSLEDGELQFTIARDKKGQDLEEKKFRVSLGVVNEVAEKGETRLIDDAASSDAYQARRSIISLSLRTIVCVPLATTHGVIGVIYVDSNAITRRFTNDDLPLIEAFASQAAATLERVRLERAERQGERLRQQMAVASEIQRTFLPSEFPDLPGVVGSVASVPALDVGGDFYDVIELPGGRVGVMVGDVSGKGVPGALFGARIMSDVRYQALLLDDVAETMTSINKIVAERVTRGMFVTFIYAVVDPASGKVVYANAGHLPPVIRRADGTIEEWPKPSSMPLGILSTTTFESGTGSLGAGDTLVLLSDGLGDAQQADGDRFGDERVNDTIATGPSDPVGLVKGLCDATAAFTGNEPQADDQTLLAIALR